MTEAEMRLHRCCFTGHRPEKLNRPEAVVKDDLKLYIRRAIGSGYSTFISGMARGVDLWAAEIVLEYKKANPEIHLIAASPFDGFEKSWSKDWQDMYRRIMNEADLVKFISPSYSRSVFQKRNEWMVDHSSMVIAVYTGEPGGTKG